MKQFKLFSLLLLFVSTATFSWGQVKYDYKTMTATASSENSAGEGAKNVFDNNYTNSRWSSKHGIDPQWLRVDLGSIKSVSLVKIFWEGANAKDYTISFSTDGTTYTDEISKTNMPTGGRTDDINVDLRCRYILINGTARNTSWGYSIWEIEVYSGVTPELSSLVLTPSDKESKFGENTQFAVAGKDQYGNDYALTGTTAWTVSGGSGATISADGLFQTTSKGIFTVMASNSGINKSVRINVNSVNPNIALTGTATASKADGNTPEKTIDGNKTGTRWATGQMAPTTPQWLMVDLGKKMKVTDIAIYWEASSAKDYSIEYSLDNSTWTTYQSKTGMPAGARVDTFYDTDIDAQYVRMSGTISNSTQWGYSIWEFAIYGFDPLGTSVSQNNSQSISLYPNPAVNEINVNGDVREITVFSLQGQKILQAVNTNRLDVSTLQSGVYLVKMLDADGTIQTEKLQKK